MARLSAPRQVHRTKECRDVQAIDRKPRTDDRAVGVASIVFTVSDRRAGARRARMPSAPRAPFRRRRRRSRSPSVRSARRTEAAGARTAGTGRPGRCGRSAWSARRTGAPGQAGTSTAITRGTIDNADPDRLQRPRSSRLRCQPGNWVVFAHVDGAHNGSCRRDRRGMECSLNDPAGGPDGLREDAGAALTVDVASRHGADACSSSLSLHGAADAHRARQRQDGCSAARPTAVGSFTLTTARMTAIQVGSIVTQ